MIDGILKLRGRSFAELRVRGSQALQMRIERLRLLAHLPPYSDLSGTDPLEARLLLEGVLNHSGEAMNDVQRTAMELAADDRLLTANLKSSAAEMKAGRISLMGLGPLWLGKPPVWQREGQSGIVAPRVHWSRVPYLDPTVVGDHKILWEANRHQYLLVPAVLWNLDGNTEDFSLIESHLASWLDDNPTGLGMNWSSSLEVAYRAITWCWLVSLLPRSLWKPDALQRILRALESHGRHIERYLSYFSSPNTHLTGEALGLLYIGHVIPGSRFARRWRELAGEILDSCLKWQIFEDGVYFEQSTHYQRYTAEIYLHYLRISESNGGRNLANLRASLGRQFDLLRTIAAGQGVIPLLGDDDGGTLFPIDHRSPDDVRGLLLAGATALKRPELVPAGKIAPAMSYWLCGVDSTRELLAAVEVPLNDGTRYFANGGIAVMRDGWRTDSAVAVVDAGRHGIGHPHADALSCTLALGEQPLFIDRGTYTYMGAERYEFRISASHNALEFDGESSVEPRGPFKWGPVPRRAVAVLRSSRDMSIFRGMAWGHAGTAQESTHSRVILHTAGGAWVFLDQGWRSQGSRVILRWQLPPGIKASTVSRNSLDITDARGAPIAHIALPGASSVRIYERDVSLRYGAKSPAVVIEALADEHFRVLSVILPASSLPTVGTVGENSWFKDNSSNLFSWKDALGRHCVALPRQPVAGLRLAGLEAEAELLWCVDRSSDQTHVVECPGLVTVVGARRLALEGGTPVVGLDSELAGQDIVIRKTPESWAVVPLNASQLGEELD